MPRKDKINEFLAWLPLRLDALSSSTGAADAPGGLEIGLCGIDVFAKVRARD